MALLSQHLRHISPIHKYIGDGAAVDVLSIRHDADRPLLQELFKPLPRCVAARLIQFRRVDAAQSDAVGSDAKGIAIDRVNWLAGW